jgi:hypothetical protein
MMHGREKSDPAIVAMKPSNEAGVPVEEMVERRAGAKGNADQQRTLRTQGRASVDQGLGRIRQAATMLRRHTPVVGAVCGKAARTVLCGGRTVMSVPTATYPATPLVATARGTSRHFRPFRYPLLRGGQEEGVCGQDGRTGGKRWPACIEALPWSVAVGGRNVAR